MWKKGRKLKIQRDKGKVTKAREKKINITLAVQDCFANNKLLEKETLE